MLEKFILYYTSQDSVCSNMEPDLFILGAIQEKDFWTPAPLPTPHPPP